jgi:hypothetical protein
MEVPKMAKPREGMDRMAVTISKELKRRINDQAIGRGLTESVYLQVILTEYFEAKDAMAQMKGLPELLDQLKELQDRQLELEGKQE